MDPTLDEKYWSKRSKGIFTLIHPD